MTYIYIYYQSKITFHFFGIHNDIKKSIFSYLNSLADITEENISNYSINYIMHSGHVKVKWIGTPSPFFLTLKYLCCRKPS